MSLCYRQVAIAVARPPPDTLQRSLALSTFLPTSHHPPPLHSLLPPPSQAVFSSFATELRATEDALVSVHGNWARDAESAHALSEELQTVTADREEHRNELEMTRPQLAEARLELQTATAMLRDASAEMEAIKSSNFILSGDKERLEKKLCEAQEALESELAQMEEEREDLDTKISEAAAAADRASRLKASECKEEGEQKLDFEAGG